MARNLAPTTAVHTARKNYLCDAPAAHVCARRITKGDPYTQLSYPPMCPPFSATPTWTIRRSCSSCTPIADADLPNAKAAPCSYGDGENQCAGARGHYPETPHEFQTALF